MRIGHTVSGVPDCCLAVVLIILVAVLVVVLILVVLVVVLVVVVLVVLIVVLVLVLVLVLHFCILQIFVLRLSRYSSVPGISGFILGFEYQAYKKPTDDGSGYAASSGFQSAGENAQKTAFIYSFPHAFC